MDTVSYSTREILAAKGEGEAMIHKIYKVITALGEGHARAFFDGRTIAWSLSLPAEDSGLYDNYAFSNGEIFSKRSVSRERESLIRTRMAELQPRFRNDVLHDNCF